MFKQLSTSLTFRSFSIKYVSKGCENYTINGKEYNVKNGQYLLVNHHCEGSAFLDSKELTKGICIDIAPDLISEIIGNLLYPDNFNEVGDFDKFFSTSAFVESLHKTTNTGVGKILQQLDQRISMNPFDNHYFEKEFYYTLAHHLVIDHLPTFKGLQAIPSVKPETKRELFRRVSDAKCFIDDHFLQNPDVADIAKNCMLSEFHFYRTFKTVHGISPHQYIIKKRIELAAEMLACGGTKMNEIATKTGFSDVYSFSKSFKKIKGTTPTDFKRNY